MDTTSEHEPFRYSSSNARPAAGSAGGGSGSPSDMVQETRREIVRLVREASLLVQASESSESFWPAFLDRVHRASAAGATVFWRVDLASGDLEPEVVHRTGEVFDSQWSDLQRRCHLQLIDEVAASSEPLLVPPTQPADEQPHALNPSQSLAVLVPVLVDGRAEGVLEVLMPTGGGIATQRGYLRFAAQMGDLAGEFLRNHLIRSLRSHGDMLNRLARHTARLHGEADSGSTAASMVDALVELFSIDRATLLIRSGKRWQALAISGVPEFDSHSPTVKSLGNYGQRRAQETIDDPWRCESIYDPDHDGDDDGLLAIGYLRLSEDSALLLQSRDGPLDAQRHTHVMDYVQHARLAWQNVREIEAIPCASILRRWANVRRSRDRLRRRAMVVGASIAVGLVVALIPVPVKVRAWGQLQPKERQVVYAPQDATVASVSVAHGQMVDRGEVLVSLVDNQLNRTIDDLLSQQNVQQQRLSELRAQMVAATAARGETTSQVEGEFQIVQQRLNGIAQQLQLLEDQRQALVLRAQRSGRVVGWQIRDELLHRPVGRGQPLLQVIDPEGDWIVRGKIPQNRFDHVQRTYENADAQGVDVTLAFRAFPHQQIHGKLKHLGMTSVESNRDDQSVGIAEIQVSATDLPLREPGANATVAISCGYRPLAYVAFEDLIRVVSEAVHAYL